MVYSILFLMGKFIFGFRSEGAVWLGVAVLSYIILKYALKNVKL